MYAPMRAGVVLYRLSFKYLSLYLYLYLSAL